MDHYTVLHFGQDYDLMVWCMPWISRRLLVTIDLKSKSGLDYDLKKEALELDFSQIRAALV
jgi:hypothetical protein